MGLRTSSMRLKKINMLLMLESHLDKDIQESMSGPNKLKMEILILDFHLLA
jgi:hypothetical protein